MTETPPSLGTPSRLLGEEMVLRAIVDVLAEALPGAKQRVLDRAHARLTSIGPKVREEAEFFDCAHTAIDEIMQIAILDSLPRHVGEVPPRARATKVSDRRPSSEPEAEASAA